MIKAKQGTWGLKKKKLVELSHNLLIEKEIEYHIPRFKGQKLGTMFLEDLRKRDVLARI